MNYDKRIQGKGTKEPHAVKGQNKQRNNNRVGKYESHSDKGNI